MFQQETVRMIVKTNMAAPNIIISNGTNIKVPIETPIIQIKHQFNLIINLYSAHIIKTSNCMQWRVSL